MGGIGYFDRKTVFVHRNGTLCAEIVYKEVGVVGKDWGRPRESRRAQFQFEFMLKSIKLIETVIHT